MNLEVITELDQKASGTSIVIWATGYAFPARCAAIGGSHFLADAEDGRNLDRIRLTQVGWADA